MTELKEVIHKIGGHDHDRIWLILAAIASVVGAYYVYKTYIAQTSPSVGAGTSSGSASSGVAYNPQSAGYSADPALVAAGLNAQVQESAIQSKAAIESQKIGAAYQIQSYDAASQNALSQAQGIAAVMSAQGQSTQSAIEGLGGLISDIGTAVAQKSAYALAASGEAMKYSAQVANDAFIAAGGIEQASLASAANSLGALGTAVSQGAGYVASNIQANDAASTQQQANLIGGIGSILTAPLYFGGTGA